MYFDRAVSLTIWSFTKRFPLKITLFRSVFPLLQYPWAVIVRTLSLMLEDKLFMQRTAAVLPAKRVQRERRRLLAAEGPFRENKDLLMSCVLLCATCSINLVLRIRSFT